MKNKILRTFVFIGLLFSFGCEDYLDKSPESIIETDDVFKDFDHAQGFVEEMYALIPDIMYGGHSGTDYNLGDDCIINNTWQPSAQIDKGNLGFWPGNQFSMFDGGRSNDVNNNTPMERPGIWNGSFWGIRKANLIIENIDQMVNATKDEKDVILGQAYFFRAFFHFEIMQYWGRFPYIDKVLGEDYKLPRPASYKESALRAHEDFKLAAQLLPVNWDDKSYGQKTFGDNKLRVTKGAAFAYMGKNMLLAASPLMKGSTDTYDYDKELASKAVDAFAEVLKLTDQGRYGLSSFANYEEVFWNVKFPALPGGTEFIFNSTGFNNGSLIDNAIATQMDIQVSGTNSKIMSPTHNFIHYNFGMSNGLSVQDDASGVYGTPIYNPEKPFENRDPRFYKWITVDGDVLAKSASAGVHKTAQLYEGGIHRNTSSGSWTGYMYKKFYPTLHSKWNNLYRKYTPWVIRMRLTDVYLMYAEALHVSKGATTAPSSYNLTAEQTINVLRDRAGIPHVNPAIVANANKFMDELRRDRSVEMSFEGHRWVDIRRWVLADKDRYKNKTGVNFPPKNAQGKYAYFTEFLVLQRVCEYPKHFWMPFKNDQTLIYEGFPQNPGW